MTTETPKNAQKGGQGAIGKQPRERGGAASGPERQRPPRQETEMHPEKEGRPGASGT